MNAEDTMEKLVKLLNLTQSDSDGEALSAMRKANQIRNQINVTWDEIVLNRSHKGTKGNGPQTKARHRSATAQEKEEIGKIFHGLFTCGKMNKRESDLVMSFESFFSRRGYLTPKQIDVLKNIYAWRVE